MTENETGLVSVIIPTYNRGHCLARALKSVLDQTYVNWEAIIVDNHSTDNTDEVLARFEDTRIKAFKIHNRGVIAASRNAGILEAKGEWIAFLDSDDWWLPLKLDVSVKALEGGEDLVYHDLYVFYENKNKKSKLKKLKTRDLVSPVFDDLLLNGNAINNSSVIVKKSILEKAGNISVDKDLIAAEDYDTWLRISKITNKFKRLRGCYGYYSQGSDNLSNSERKERNILRLGEIYCLNNEYIYPVWMNYSLARLYSKNQNFKKSKQYALNVIKKMPSPKVFVKSVITYFFAVWQLKIFARGNGT